MTGSSAAFGSGSTPTVLIDAVGINVPGVELADFFALTPDELMERTFHDPDKFKTDPQHSRANSSRHREPTAPRSPSVPEIPTCTTLSSGAALCSVPYGRAYAESFPNARFELIPEAGHLPQIEQPERVLQSIRRFAAETRSAAVE